MLHCGVVCNFTVNQGELVQIIHSVPGHWLTVSTVGLKHPNIAILDSAYSNISSTTGKQIASIMCTQEKYIKLSFLNVQKQVSNLFKTN